MERNQLLHRAEAQTLVSHPAVATGPHTSVRIGLELAVTSHFTGESGTERGRWSAVQRRSMVQLLPPNPSPKKEANEEVPGSLCSFRLGDRQTEGYTTYLASPVTNRRKSI